MSTLLGALFGYVLRGVTGSEGFRDVVGSARALRESPEFDSLLRAARTHAGFVIKDLSSTLSAHADQLADTLTGEESATNLATPAAWETWPGSSSRPGRPFTDEVPWPD